MIRDTGTNILLGQQPMNRRLETGSIAEHYNALLRNLRLHIDGANLKPQAIGIASLPGCGDFSVVATNLAICLANADDREVLLVNANPRNRVPETTFSLDTNRGVYDLLGGACGVDEIVQKTQISNLKAVSCGQFKKGFEPFSCLMKFGDVLTQFKRERSMVILDLPCASEFTPCFDMATCLDGIVLEVESSNVKREQAMRTLSQLRFADANVLGCVFKQT